MQPSQNPQCKAGELIDLLEESLALGAHPTYSRIEARLISEGLTYSEAELRKIRDLALDCALLPARGILGGYEVSLAQDLAVLAHKLLRQVEGPGAINLAASGLPPRSGGDASPSGSL